MVFFMAQKQRKKTHAAKETGPRQSYERAVQGPAHRYPRDAKLWALVDVELIECSFRCGKLGKAMISLGEGSIFIAGVSMNQTMCFPFFAKQMGKRLNLDS